MGETCLLLFLGLPLTANCMNLEHVVILNSSLANISSSSAAQASLSTLTPSTTSTTTLTSSLAPTLATGSSYSTTTLSSNKNGQGSTTLHPEKDSIFSKSDEDQREERIMNTSGQSRNQGSNIRRRGDKNRRRLGEQTRRRLETRKRIEVRQKENLWGGSRRKTISRPSQFETDVQWDRSDPRSN